jgi:type I protein arginine methyltransferase
VQAFCNKVVVDAFDPSILQSTVASHAIDFNTAVETDLHDICIPLSLVCKGPKVVHGIACWFDVLFPGSTKSVWLSTAPGMPPTHWFQLRCVLQVLLLLLFMMCALTNTVQMRDTSTHSSNQPHKKGVSKWPM